MYLLDTNVLIAVLRGNQNARDWLHHARAQGQFAVSTITVAEMYAGAWTSEISASETLLSIMRILPVDPAVAKRAGTWKRQYQKAYSGVDLADYLIAATAEIYGYELATTNNKHYPMFPNLKPPFAS